MFLDDIRCQIIKDAGSISITETENDEQENDETIISSLSLEVSTLCFHLAHLNTNLSLGIQQNYRHPYSRRRAIRFSQKG